MENREESKGDDLTEKQKKFCGEYIFDFNATRSYKIAYQNTSDAAARSSSSELLTKPNIQAYIAELQADLSKTSGISRLKVLKEHEKIAFSSIAKLHNTWIERKKFDELSDEEKACISEIQTQVRRIVIEGMDAPVEVEFVKVKLFDKQKSLDSISKMLGFDAASKVEIKSDEKQVIIIGGKEIEF